MTKSKKKDPPPLEHGLNLALRALDSQIMREMQRSPAERDQLGVQKWTPINKRVEIVTALLVTELASEQYSIESLCVLAQATSKALMILSEELGSTGLGSLRTDYAIDTFDKINHDLRRGKAGLNSEQSNLPQ